MQDPDKTMHEAQSKMLSYADELAKNKGITLGHADDSMKVLDILVSSISREFKAGGVETSKEFEGNSSAKGVATSLGCYIVEYIERKQGKGVWMDRDPQTKEPAYCFQLPNGSVIFPFDWITKKLISPTAYSLQETYQKWVA